MMSLVERAVEMRHSQVHKAIYGHRSGPLIVSSRLRLPSFVDTTVRDPLKFIDYCRYFEAVRSMREMATVLCLQNHPNIKKLLEQQDPRAHASALMTSIVAVVYGLDQESKYAKYGEAKLYNKTAKTAIQDAARTWKKTAAKCAIGGIDAVRSSALQDHFVQLAAANPEVIYAFPVGFITPALKELRAVLSDPGMKPASGTEEFALVDELRPDGGYTDDIHQVAVAAVAAGPYDAESFATLPTSGYVFLRVIETKPNRAKVIPTAPAAAGALRTGSLAVTVHRACEFTKMNAPIVDVSPAVVHGSGNPAMVIESLGSDAVGLELCCWSYKQSRELCYSVAGCDDATVMNFVTNMVKAGAFQKSGESGVDACDGGYFVRGTDVERTGIASRLESENVIQTTIDPPSSFYCKFTAHGLSRLRAKVKLLDPALAFQCRDLKNVASSQVTRLDLMNALSSDGWAIVHKKPAPYFLDGVKQWYMASKAKTVHSTYLRSLLAASSGKISGAVEHGKSLDFTILELWSFRCQGFPQRPDVNGPYRITTPSHNDRLCSSACVYLLNVF
jgi:hypothetical protein